MYESWIRIVSFILLSFLTLPVESLPKHKGTATTGTTSNTKANAAAAAAAPASPSGGITKATDGSTILDKTVTIKLIFQPTLETDH
jgi:hypothetical protein